MAYNNDYNKKKKDDDFHFDLIEHIAVLAERDSGWTREVNIISWNGASAKVDLRDWGPDHEKMSKGFTLFEEEAEKLAKALCGRYGIRFGSDTASGSEPQPSAPSAPAAAASFAPA